MASVAKRKTRIAVGYVAGTILCAGAVAAGLVVSFLTGSIWGSVLAIVAACALMVLAMAVGWAWMRTLDEAAREAHKAAWYWGGSGAMALAGVPIILAMMPWAETLRFEPVLMGRDDPAAWMAVGAFALMMIMTLGYIVAWVWWWLSKR